MTASLLNNAGVPVQPRHSPMKSSQVPANRRSAASATPEGGGFRVAAQPAEVGRVALEHLVVLTELRPADSAGLEDLFLTLTTTTDAAAPAEEIPA